MKQIKILGLVALTAAAITALAGSASATTLTSPSGTTYTSTIKLVSEGNLTFKNALQEGACEWSLEGKVEGHGPAVTASSRVSTLMIPSWGECFGNSSISVLNAGTLEFHTDGESVNGDGIVTWAGFEITITYHGLGVSCKYGTGAGATLGTLTGSKGTGFKATVDLGSFTLPRTGHSFFCGSSATMTGSFQLTTPTYLDVD